MADISHSRDATIRTEDSEEKTSSKRRKFEALTLTDRLSELPDSLILHILFLVDSTKQVVRTSTLSKRWKDLWTNVQSFNFTYTYTNSVSDFVTSVRKTLAQCDEGCKLKRFKISFNLQKGFEECVEFWIFYAIFRNVEDLDIDVASCYGDNHEFVLPELIFSNSVFTKLRFGYCFLDPQRAIDWKMLKVLRISQTQLNEDLIENILGGSPMLEILELDRCYGFNRLDITSKSVKKLVFNGYSPHETQFDVDDVVEVNAPSISSLDIIGFFLLWKVLLLDVSSLINANLDYKKHGHWDFLHTTRSETREEMLKGFIQKLHHVKDLTIGVFCSSALSRLEAKGFSFPSNIRFPVLTSPIYSSSEEEDWEEPVVNQGQYGNEVDLGPDDNDVDNGPNGNEDDLGHDDNHVVNEPNGN